MSPEKQHLDLVVVGSGVAGLSAAVRAADHGLRVGVVTRGRLDQATTRWAQGGITLETVADYAATGVDCVSSGSLTQAAPALDIGLDLDR